MTDAGPRAALANAATPIVSAIIIFYNELPWLEQSIASVLAQTYPHWELLLVDDGSADGSTAVARAAADRHPGRVRYLEHPRHANQGMSAARNQGIRHARGEYVAFLDADDVWLPHKLEMQIAVLEGRPDVDMVYGDTQFWYSWTGRAEDAARDCPRGVSIAAGTVIEPPDMLTRCYPLGDAPSPAMCSFLIRRSVLERVGGSVTEFRGMFEDQALLAKLYLAATIMVTHDCLARYRMHERSCVSTSILTGGIDDATHAFLSWLETHLRTHGVTDLRVRQRLRTALRPYRHPRLHAARGILNRIAGQAAHAARAAANRLRRAIARKSTGTLAAQPNPIVMSDRFALGAVTLEWHTAGAVEVEVRLDSATGMPVTRGGPSGSTTTGTWVSDGMCFHLQDVSGGLPLTKANTIASVRVGVRRRRADSAIVQTRDEPPNTAGGAAVNAPQAHDPVAATPHGAVILLYHRVAGSRSDPWALAVSPANFEDHLHVLRSTCTVLDLEHLCSAAGGGVLPPRAVAVTFDDGYVDVLRTAKPLLERHEIPATVFVPTGLMGGLREFWWDEIERIVLRTPTLPEQLCLTVRGTRHEWELGDAARTAVAGAYPGWRAWGMPDPTTRHHLFRSLYEVLYALSYAERADLQEELLAWAGVGAVAETSDRRVVSADELVALEQGALVTIGAHTVTHSLLAAAPIDAQRDEIVHNRQMLENVLGRSVTSFAYPFGKHGDYTADTVRLVQEAGFSVACANVPGLVTHDSDPFQLPRIYVFDWTGDEFAHQLSNCFAG